MAYGWRSRNCSRVGFKSLSDELFYSRIIHRNLLGNLALLLPLGLLGPIALPALDRWWRVLLLELAYSATIELIQLAVPDRSADIDDVIVNVTGALLGYAALRAVRRAQGARG